MIKRSYYLFQSIWLFIRKRLDAVLNTGVSSKILNPGQIASLMTLYRENSDNKKTECIIFSRDRPLQLECLLSGLKNYVRGISGVHVLYRADSEVYAQAYEKVHSEHKNVVFVLENDFREQLISLLEKMKSSRIMFLVDDIVIINKFSLDVFKEFSLYEFVPSIRLGENIRYQYTRQKKQAVPYLKKKGNLRIWNWRDADHYSDWAYPFSVDGNVFLKDEILLYIRNITFRAPNSLETALQVYNDLLFHLKKGVCCKNSVICNNPVNRVQNEIENFYGKSHQDELLKSWTKGKRLDSKRYIGFNPEGAHQEMELYFKD